MEKITLIITTVDNVEKSVEYELLSEPKEVYYWDREANEIKKGTKIKIRSYEDKQSKYWEERYREQILNNPEYEDLTDDEIDELVEKERETISYWEYDIIVKNNRIVVKNTIYPFTEGYSSAEECIARISKWYNSVISDFQKAFDKFKEAKVVE